MRSPRDFALLAGAALIAGFAIRRGINPHDEGLMLAAADRITRGELPWRDFWWNYGPAEPFALAGLQELFGRSLLAWRIVHVALAAIAGLLTYRLVRREAPRSFALAAWLATVGALSYPLIPNPLTPALTLGLGGLLVARRRPVLAGLLAGIALTFRADVGLAALLAVAIAATAAGDHAAGARPAGRRAALRAGAVALATGIVLTAPLAVAAGAARWADQTVGFALHEQALQRLPLPHDGGDANGLNGGFEHLFPTILLIATLLTLALGIERWVRTRQRPPRLSVAASPLALAGTLYLLSRADEFHVALLAATLGLVAAPLLAQRGRERGLGRLATPVIAIALLLPAVYALDRKLDALRHPPVLTALHVAAADGVRADPRDAHALNRLVPLVARLTRPDAPVFIANPRHDRVRVGDPLLSVLIARPNPSRYPIMQPGVVTKASVQREIVGELKRSRTGLVVRWLSPVADQRERNGAGREHGARILDRYLAAHFRERTRIGDYAVLVRR